MHRCTYHKLKQNRAARQPRRALATAHLRLAHSTPTHRRGQVQDMIRRSKRMYWVEPESVRVWRGHDMALFMQQGEDSPPQRQEGLAGAHSARHAQQQRQCVSYPNTAISCGQGGAGQRQREGQGGVGQAAAATTRICSLELPQARSSRQEQTRNAPGRDFPVG